MINIEHLTKTYNEGRANECKVLTDVNLEVNRGEKISIIGKSGCGKSTLLHIIALIDSFQKGEYNFNNTPVRAMSNQELARLRNRSIGLVLQDFALISEYTVMENVLLPTMFTICDNHQMKKRAEMLLSKTGLIKFKNHYASQLSGGQKQRVAICRSLINDPDLILADEPTGSLDPQTGTEIISLLIEMCDSNKALIVITHDLDIAQQFPLKYQLSNGELACI